jgi:hypothetical protein
MLFLATALGPLTTVEGTIKGDNYLELLRDVVIPDNGASNVSIKITRKGCGDSFASVPEF